MGVVEMGGVLIWFIFIYGERVFMWYLFLKGKVLEFFWWGWVKVLIKLEFINLEVVFVMEILINF